MKKSCCLFKKNLQILMVLILIAPVLSLTATGQSVNDKHLAKARKVLQATPLVDGHNDLLYHFFIASKKKGDFETYNIAERTSGQTDLPRLKQGMVGAQLITVTGLDDNSPMRGMVETIDFVRRMVERYPNQLAYAESVSDIRRAFSQKRVATLMAIEGGSQIENSLVALRTYYKLGVRSMTLTHETKSSDWAPAALDKSRSGGLTEFGKTAVIEMNRLGMLIDLSHASPEVARDAVAISQAPVIFSHSSARAKVDTPRNVSDEMLRMLRKNGGILMVSFVPYFTTKEYSDWYYKGEEIYQSLLKKHEANREAANKEMSLWEKENPSPRVTVSDVADHIEHIKAIAGADHIGLGSDFDGMYGKIEGLEDVSTFPTLFAELVRRGWTETELRKLAGENFLRVFAEAEFVSQKLKSIGTVSVLKPNQ